MFKFVFTFTSELQMQVVGCVASIGDLLNKTCCLFQTRNLSEESCCIPRKFVFTYMVDLKGKIQLFL